MELKINFENEQAVEQQIKMNMDRLGNVVRDAMREAAMETRDFMQARGAEDIEEAGNFGQRWQDALKVEVTETQRTFRVTAKMEASEPPVVYWPVFEYGATIEPKKAKYLWIPFRGAAGTDVWPSVYGYPENLFYAESRKGTPILWDKESKEPKYHGHDSVTIPKKFHLHEIMKDEAQKARAAFKRILAEMRAE